MPLLLGVNVDHVATLRQARRGSSPSPLEIAREAVAGGADSIVVHLREDRRHIQEGDVRALARSLKVPLDLEMSAAPNIVRIATQVRPVWCCLVPERRQELTTEGGLAVAKDHRRLIQAISRLKKSGVQVSLFVNPRKSDIRLSKQLGADAVELHTGRYAQARSKSRLQHLHLLRAAKDLALELGLTVNAGHGLDYENVPEIASLPGLHALNIGFSIVSRALRVGMEQAVREMKELMRGA